MERWAALLSVIFCLLVSFCYKLLSTCLFSFYYYRQRQPSIYLFFLFYIPTTYLQERSWPERELSGHRHRCSKSKFLSLFLPHLRTLHNSPSLSVHHVVLCFVVHVPACEIVFVGSDRRRRVSGPGAADVDLCSARQDSFFGLAGSIRPLFSPERQIMRALKIGSQIFLLLIVRTPFCRFRGASDDLVCPPSGRAGGAWLGLWREERAWGGVPENPRHGVGVLGTLRRDRMWRRGEAGVTCGDGRSCRLLFLLTE